MRDVKILVAELVGTMILILAGPGSAILAGDRIHTAGVAFAFGLSLLIAAYTIGPISGCHINPAVTLAMWITRKIPTRTLPAYIIGQLLGAFAGAAVIFSIANGIDGFSAKDNFAGNACYFRSKSYKLNRVSETLFGGEHQSLIGGKRAAIP